MNTLVARTADCCITGNLQYKVSLTSYNYNYFSYENRSIFITEMQQMSPTWSLSIGHSTVELRPQMTTVAMGYTGQVQGQVTRPFDM